MYAYFEITAIANRKFKWREIACRFELVAPASEKKCEINKSEASVRVYYKITHMSFQYVKDVFHNKFLSPSSFLDPPTRHTGIFCVSKTLKISFTNFFLSSSMGISSWMVNNFRHSHHRFSRSKKKAVLWLKLNYSLGLPHWFLCIHSQNSTNLNPQHHICLSFQ